jgi:hypothetical protein
VSQGPRLRLLSYNVHGLRDDVDALAAVVRAAEPDVVVLREAPRRLRWRAKSAALAHGFGLVVAGGGLPALGNLVLTGRGRRRRADGHGDVPGRARDRHNFRKVVVSAGPGDHNFREVVTISGAGVVRSWARELR